MNNRFHWSASGATLFQLAAEVSCIVAAVGLTARRRPAPGSRCSTAGAGNRIFALLMVALNNAFGLYRRDGPRTQGDCVEGNSWRSPSARRSPGWWPRTSPAARRSVTRWSSGRWWRSDAGAGAARDRDAAARACRSPIACWCWAPARRRGWWKRSLTTPIRAGCRSWASIRWEGSQEVAVSPAPGRAPAAAPSRRRCAIWVWTEIIVAVREQRGGVLPLRALLECRLAGIQGHRPAALLRARAWPDPHRVAEGELAHLRQRFPAELAAHDGQAHVRYRRVDHAADRHAAR